MMMVKYAVVAGHNANVLGANGNGYKEHEMARKIKDAVIFYLKELNQTVFDCTDDIGRNKTDVWLNAAKNCNDVVGEEDYIIAIHLNAGGGTGTEVFDFKGTSKAVCERISARLAKDFQWNNRGWKDGSWIGLIKETKGKVIYVEVCFIDNVTDMTKLSRNIGMAGIGIVESITGTKIPVKAEVEETGILYTVQVGAFKSKDNAERLRKQLLDQGYVSFINTKKD
jgi:N-acetylmuramoyl-L-alanine amidase